MSVIPPPVDDEFDTAPSGRPAPPPSQPMPAAGPAQDQADLAQIAAQFYAIRQRVIEALRRCGGEQFIYALIEYTQPPNVKLAFSRALEYEGDPIVIFMNALRFYLTVMYIEAAPAAGGGGGRRGGRRASSDEEEVMDQAELEKKVQDEVVKQVVARVLAEEEKKKQVQTENPFQALFMQALQQQLQRTFAGMGAGGMGLGGLPTQAQPTQKPSETPKERRKIVDVDSI